MNVTIIYGTITKGNTYNCVQLLLNNLKLINTNIKVTEFFLSTDLPYFYSRRNTSLISAEDRPPQINYVDSIIKSLNNSDLLILASPVYTCDISTEMKLFLDYLSHKFITHKTNSFMDNKIGLVISTSAGAGLFNTCRTLKKALNFLGVNNVFRFTETIYETNWENVTLKRKIQINKQISKLSSKILALHISLNTVSTPFFSKITSSNTQPMHINNNQSIINLSYWKKHSCSHNKNVH